MMNLKINSMKYLTKISETISSREIAELTGKPHNDVLKAIRAMESAWEKVNEGKFSLVEYMDAKGEKRPMYELTKTESLYVATKFNDEARAKLILRWEELETKARLLPSEDEILLLAMQTLTNRVEQQKEQLLLANATITHQAPKVEYYDTVLQSQTLIPTTSIAKELGMSATTLNKLLHESGVQYRMGNQWVLYHKYQNKGYTGTKTTIYKDSLGREQTQVHTYWTEKGKEFILSLEFIKIK